ncbi:MAG TPA: DUF4349 domain-containing protein, partial [Chloroflexota bacterium]|nr:DUF4349 domain-containing protein [Chloroflexota bacterium]
PAAAPKASAPSASGQSPQESASSADGGERMVIRSVSLKLIVTDVDDVLSRVGLLAKDAGGYVVSSSSQDRNGDRVGQATLRVPSNRLDESVKQIKGMATRVGSETSSAKDVTEEFVDQDARLKTLKATESQYLLLMQNANSIDDVVKVQQVLQQTRQEIEQTQGRMQYLQRSTEMAFVSLDLSTTAAAKPLSEGGWSVQDVANEAVRALLSMGEVLVTLAIWIGVFSPLWVPTWLLIRWWRRRRAGRRAARPAPVETTTTPPAPPAPQTA